MHSYHLVIMRGRCVRGVRPPLCLRLHLDIVFYVGDFYILFLVKTFAALTLLLLCQARFFVV